MRSMLVYVVVLVNQLNNAVGLDCAIKLRKLLHQYRNLKMRSASLLPLHRELEPPYGDWRIEYILGPVLSQREAEELIDALVEKKPVVTIDGVRRNVIRVAEQRMVMCFSTRPQLLKQ